MNEKINYEIEEILTYLKDINDLEIKDFNDLITNRQKLLSSCMCIFNIINSTIEIGEEIISTKKFETPLKYREIYEILNNNKVLSLKVSKKLSSFIYQRNMLAHQYGKLNKRKIYEVVKEKNVFLDFIDEIKIFLQSDN
ncbi:MAG: type VII toxin-antitoxin system HepT family RNase toxin [Nanoarchaeota archaeon]